MLELDSTTHGFKLVRKEQVDEVNSEALVFEHVKTGAETIILCNDDDNKVFMICFPTPSENSTGVPPGYTVLPRSERTHLYRTLHFFCLRKKPALETGVLPTIPPLRVLVAEDNPITTRWWPGNSLKRQAIA